MTNISPHGFWLLLEGDEKLLPFKDFPWFKSATVAQICHVEPLRENHLYWPDLDIDLPVASIDHPERFPRVSMVVGRTVVAEKTAPDHRDDWRILRICCRDFCRSAAMLRESPSHSPGTAELRLSGPSSMLRESPSHSPSIAGAFGLDLTSPSRTAIRSSR